MHQCVYRLYQTLTTKPNHKIAFEKSHALVQILREMTESWLSIQMKKRKRKYQRVQMYT